MPHRKCLAALLLAATLPAAAQNNPVARPGPASILSLNGYWNGANLESRSNCTTAGVNGNHGTYAQYLFSASAAATGGGSLHIHETTESGLTCDWDGGYTDDRLVPVWTGTLACSDGKQATFTSTSFLITPTEMQVRAQMKWSNSERCDVDAILGGSRFN